MTEKQHVNSCKDIQKRSEFFNSLVIWFSIEWVLGEAWISIAEKNLTCANWKLQTSLLSSIW